MADPLFEPAPGFDQPIAVLEHCHDRIRKQLRTLQKLVTHLSEFGPDLDARQGANAILRYFNNAACHHHADEEVDLLPMLQHAANEQDAALLDKLVPEITEEHLQMGAAWHILDRQLQGIAARASSELSQQDVSRFAAAYAAHMEKEETHIAPMALRLFSDAQMKQLGEAMRARRGIA
jgi:hemerythrin-like domain-containing protein